MRWSVENRLGGRTPVKVEYRVAGRHYQFSGETPVDEEGWFDIPMPPAHRLGRYTIDFQVHWDDDLVTRAWTPSSVWWQQV